MIRGLKVGVLVPAYNEERLILKTLGNIPEGVERVLVVDDGSSDRTPELLASVSDPRVGVVRHERNRGLGQALATGYRRALEETGIDVWAVMAGDNQMDPADLEALIAPIAEGRAQYVKGNRLFHPEVWRIMPAYRFFGNSMLTLLTKFATGYFQLLDPQCGYTAIQRDAIRCFDLERPHPGYGYNAHLLMQLNLYNVAVTDVPVRPVYGEAQSKIRLRSYVPTVAWLLLRCFARRIFLKYVLRDFHPIGLVYLALCALTPIALYSGGVLAYQRLSHLSSPLSLDSLPSLLLFVLTALASLILFLFAIWMDIEYTRSRDPYRGFGPTG